MKDKAEIAKEKYEDGYSCAQAVLYVFADELNLEPDTALKLACGFGAGMGKQQEVCGAVSGGIMVLGMRCGRGENDGPEAKDTTYANTREFIKLFTEKNGSFICRELLEGCDLLTEEGASLFKEKEYSKNVCASCVQSAVRILETVQE